MVRGAPERDLFVAGFSAFKKTFQFCMLNHNQQGVPVVGAGMEVFEHGAVMFPVGNTGIYVIAFGITTS
ncbi:hypothetical protein GCM10007041_37630 [Butyricimonas faecihominis]|jgi:hypothetical protein|nr:hypothetical protein Bfae18676_33630 [Butyricimonas faecihominis]GGJ44402.1 hypothetical protein GCM10007041_37630 [Butyricimonas faecihominis]